MTKIAISYPVHDDSYYLAQSIASFREGGDLFVFVNRIPYYGQPGDWETAAQIARDAGAEVVLTDWKTELEYRQGAQQYLLERGYTHALLPDGDEIIEPLLLSSLVKIAEAELADRVYVHWDTYWKTPEYMIRPREAFKPIILIDLRNAQPTGIRAYDGGRELLLSPAYGIMHHLSYVGPDCRIRRKVESWSHATEVQKGWLQNVWMRWDNDRLLPNLHPTHPPAYGFAERIHVPELLALVLARYRELAGGEDLTPALVPSPASWPKVSLIIPLYGGSDDIRDCLQSLAACQDLLHEVFVVDNASPDDAAEVAASFPFARLLRHETNQGFSAACNRGAAEASGDVLLFLNSDTVVPRAGLLRLIETLIQSGSIAASGPYTNWAGHLQQMQSTYTALATLDLFAEDFAQRPQEDIETDMLVGFCLAVRRAVWDEVGSFDERFGLGNFEDNDLCYRMRRAGYRLVIAARSWVHHKGSQTMQRMPDIMRQVFLQNRDYYQQKWREDLATGYASSLAGLSPERVVFDPARHPDKRARQVAELARRVDISLCMIVRNEERVLGDALASARPFFSEMIVVDTGSTDRTVEIAREAGAKVFDFPWTDSFAEARNESLRHASGKWIFWMDADDTLPLACGEALLQAALGAPDGVSGFIVPVQFVEDGSAASGTRVDHVKLFRNLPGLAFEGRIHEQILPALRASGGGIARCDAFVLHSGYDTSEAGQARKRERDWKLLRLDLEERPDHPFVLFNLGMTAHYTGGHEEAVEWLRKCLNVSGPTDSHVRKAYALLALSLRAQERISETLEVIETGLQAAPGDPELHFHAARALAEQGRQEEAKGHYLQTLAANNNGHFSSVDVGILGFKTYHNLGGVCHTLGQYREAKDWWQKAMQAAPQFLPSVFDLFNAALENSDMATARQMLETIERREGSGLSWASLAVRYYEAQGGPEEAHQFLWRSVASHPEAIGPRVLLMRRLLESSCEPQGLEQAQALSEMGVAEGAYCLGVAAIRRDALAEALTWMERAQALNPEHEETQKQVIHLKRALAANG